ETHRPSSETCMSTGGYRIRIPRVRWTFGSCSRTPIGWRATGFAFVDWPCRPQTLSVATHVPEYARDFPPFVDFAYHLVCVVPSWNQQTDWNHTDKCADNCPIHTPGIGKHLAMLACADRIGGAITIYSRFFGFGGKVVPWGIIYLPGAE